MVKSCFLIGMDEFVVFFCHSEGSFFKEAHFFGKLMVLFNQLAFEQLKFYFCNNPATDSVTGWNCSMGDLTVACLLPHVRMGGETVTLNRNLDKVGFLVVLSLPALCN